MNDHHVSNIIKLKTKKTWSQSDWLQAWGKELGTMLLLFSIVKRIQYLDTEILLNKEAASHNYIRHRCARTVHPHNAHTQTHFFLFLWQRAQESKLMILTLYLKLTVEQLSRISKTTYTSCSWIAWLGSLDLTVSFVCYWNAKLKKQNGVLGGEVEKKRPGSSPW
jgi:hypothetical protein